MKKSSWDEASIEPFGETSQTGRPKFDRDLRIRPKIGGGQDEFAEELQNSREKTNVPNEIAKKEQNLISDGNTSVLPAFRADERVTKGEINTN